MRTNTMNNNVGAARSLRSYLRIHLLALALTALSANACDASAAAEPSADAIEGEAEPVAPVRVASVTHETLIESRSLPGVLAFRAGQDLVITAPFDCQVVASRGVPEGAVSEGAALFEIAPTPSGRAGVTEARAEHDAAVLERDAVQALFDRRLTTADVLAAADGAVLRAESHMRSMRASGGSSAQTLVAPVDALVVSIEAAAGEWVAAGTVLARLRPTAGVEAVLGIEPRDISALAPGAALNVQSVDGAFAPVSGRVTFVGAQADAQSRRVPVHVSVPPGPHMLAGLRVRGTLEIAPQMGLVVPHAALVPTDDGMVVFVVREGHAARVGVNVLLEVDGRALVDTEGLSADDQVVIEGGYQLAHGLAVEVLQ